MIKTLAEQVYLLNVRWRVLIAATVLLIVILFISPAYYSGSSFCFQQATDAGSLLRKLTDSRTSMGWNLESNDTDLAVSVVWREHVHLTWYELTATSIN